ncbi:2-oxo acid dehydrogenase subunit E2 [Flavobacteriaceae bacterium]|nr:2-oxo acid dehydrogenase subunit E2 [Flavobacteriaceae bacterium]MDA8704089.1 2-oxo acid dehydrogenase subunit E2 [Flavobacteriaceae bacterium]MDA9850997.1 2-oxo acid dehydrogenase subunit E2 [Flavobacteriaceae bacterium]MDB3874374.1 2-oxo acid dehydrogenase subunit E2 [Flavobacteriaceae bacterium]MDC0560166.1 2-oxo acid dehydrogenase subunit E2 [Flavobacteriaceae bacterium]
MGKYLLKLPKMGESIAEATITKWLKEVGDTVDIDESLVEIATDKVDSDVPSEFKGKLIKKNFEVNDVVKVGEVIAEIETDLNDDTALISENEDIELVHAEKEKELINDNIEEINIEEKEITSIPSIELLKTDEDYSENNPEIVKSDKFFSPLVKNIAKKENITQEDLNSISGSGKDGRVTKQDILNYIGSKSSKSSDSFVSNSKPLVGDQIIELDRMGKIIFDHMSNSKKISAHVQSFIEVDVSNLWDWRDRYKKSFLENEGLKLTFTPLFINAVVKSLKDYPIMNSTIVDQKIIMKRSINIGMATAVKNGNLIVPVIKNADHLNLKGLTLAVNDLSNRARSNSLKPEEVSDGTYTVTNVGNFGSIMGTPIINQPQVGIIAIGVIRKTPSVIETNKGDFIGIRKKLILSHTYDHRIINGSIGGSFVKRVAEYLEEWDMNQTI